MLQTLQLEQKTASQLEAFQIQYGLNTSEAIEKLLTIAKTEAAFDRLMGKESMPDDKADRLVGFTKHPRFVPEFGQSK